jgi:mannose-6-phosphate isomerase-like protein (cupin superfamily)
MKAWVKEIREEELAPVDLVPQGFWKRYVTPDSDGRGMVFGMGKLMPGEEVSHGHIEEELFYVLSGFGEATWELDGSTQRAELKPGAAFYKTSHVEHTMRNTGEEPLLGLFFKV